MFDFFVDPGNQAAGKRHTESFVREVSRTKFFGNFAVDCQNGRARILQIFGNNAVESTHLFKQFAHVGGAGAGSSLVGHGRDPFDQVSADQAVQGHQHQADCAVAADIVLNAFTQALLNDVHVHRVENNDGVLFHTQRGSSVNPVAVPAFVAKRFEVGFCPVTALAGNDDIASSQCVQIIGILQNRIGIRNFRCFAAGVTGREECGADKLKVVFLLHSVHQHGADHSSPANHT